MNSKDAEGNNDGLFKKNTYSNICLEELRYEMTRFSDDSKSQDREPLHHDDTAVCKIQIHQLQSIFTHSTSTGLIFIYPYRQKRRQCPPDSCVQFTTFCQEGVTKFLTSFLNAKPEPLFSPYSNSWLMTEKAGGGGGSSAATYVHCTVHEWRNKSLHIFSFTSFFFLSLYLFIIATVH